jgi:hypothetical protein
MKCKTCDYSRVSKKGTLFCRIHDENGYRDLPCRDIIYCQLLYGPFDFSQVLLLIEEGWAFTRKEWYGLFGKGPQPLTEKGWSKWFRYIEREDCDDFGKLEDNPIYLHSPRYEEKESWIPTQTDILAKDWYLMEKENILKIFRHELCEEEQP